jgi:hypothetical protein
MKVKKYLSLTALFISAILASNYCLSDGSKDAEKALLRYLHVMTIGDFERMAELMHPSETDKVKSAYSKALTSRKRVDAQRLYFPVFEVSNIQQFERLESQEVYARLLTNTFKYLPKNVYKGMKFDIISTSIADNKAYIVYSMSLLIGEERIAEDQLQKLTKDNNRWYLMLPTGAEDELHGIVSGYR